MFLDTSGLFCYIHRDEAQHADAMTYFHASSDKLIQNYVLSEFVALASVRRLPRAAAISFATDLVDHPDIDVVWVSESLHREALQLLTTHLDKTYSLCDAVSFILMRQRHVAEALTTDQHFEQAGFRRLLKP